jgi:predicted ATPase
VHDFHAPDEVLARLTTTVDGFEHAEAIVAYLAQVLGIEEGHSSPEETAWAIRRFLEILSVDRPVVAFWEDVHWAEPPFLDAIDHLADWTRDAPILVLCTARPEFLDDRPGWGGGKFNASAVSLPPLDTASWADLIANLLGGSGLPVGVTERVNEAGGGNPLFVEQMVSMLIDDGLLVREGNVWRATGDLTSLAVPPSVVALLAARLDRLGEDERDLLGCASVVGRVFYLGAVQALLPEPLRDAATGLIGSVARKELVREDPPSPASKPSRSDTS